MTSKALSGVSTCTVSRKSSHCRSLSASRVSKSFSRCDATSALASARSRHRRAATAASPRRRRGITMSRAIAAHGSLPASTRPGQAQCRRTTVVRARDRSVPADELVAVGGHRVRRRIGRHEGHAVAIVEAVGILCQQRAGRLVKRRHDRRCRAGAVVAEHPFGIGVDAQPRRSENRNCGSPAARSSPGRRDRQARQFQSPAARA